MTLHALATRQYPAKPADVYLFSTCLVDPFSPQAGLDTVRLLEREGIRVHYLEKQTCCGQPAHSSGYPDEARSVALHHGVCVVVARGGGKGARNALLVAHTRSKKVCTAAAQSSTPA